MTLTEQMDTQPDWNDDDRLVFLRRGADETGARTRSWVLDYAEFQGDRGIGFRGLPRQREL